MVTLDLIPDMIHDPILDPTGYLIPDTTLDPKPNLTPDMIPDLISDPTIDLPFNTFHVSSLI